jgi:hypothetical protein
MEMKMILGKIYMVMDFKKKYCRIQRKDENILILQLDIN